MAIFVSYLFSTKTGKVKIMKRPKTTFVKLYIFFNFLFKSVFNGKKDYRLS